MSGSNDHKRQILAENGVTGAEWIVLLTAAYEIPIPESQFVHQAAWEGRAGMEPHVGDVGEPEIAEALERCLTKGWVGLNPQAREGTATDAETGEQFTFEIPETCVMLTKSGEDLHHRICSETHPSLPA